MADATVSTDPDTVVGGPPRAGGQPEPLLRPHPVGRRASRPAPSRGRTGSWPPPAARASTWSAPCATWAAAARSSACCPTRAATSSLRCWPARGSRLVGRARRPAASAAPPSSSRTRGRATVLNEPGPTVGADRAGGRCSTRSSEARRRRSHERIVACSGSLPPGLPDDTYGRVVGDRATPRRRRASSTAPAPRWPASLPSGPDLVTPNLAEAEGLITGTHPRAVPRRGRPGGRSRDRRSPPPTACASAARGERWSPPASTARPTSTSDGASTGSTPRQRRWPTPSAPATPSWLAC